MGDMFMSCDNKNNYNINCCGPLKLYYLIPGPVGPTGPTGSTGATGATGPAWGIETNPYNLYVQADAAPGGDGSQDRPFHNWVSFDSFTT